MSPQEENPLLTKAIEILDEFIHQKKLRKTPERYHLLDIIYSQEGHFEVEDLYQIVSKNKKFNLSKATLYNSLELFVESGIVTRHFINSSTAIFEKSYGQKQHDHFICEKCKTVKEFCDPRLYMIKKSLESMLKVTINSHNLYLKGICDNPKCQE